MENQMDIEMEKNMEIDANWNDLEAYRNWI